MISDAQRRAVHAYVLACLNLDLATGMTALRPEQVAWELQDLPRSGTGAWCSLRVIAATPMGVPERIELEADGVLEVTTREAYEVAISVVLRHRQSDAAPSWATDAGLRLRRVLLGRMTDIHDELARAGAPIVRVSGMRDLTGLHRGSQWESAAQVDLTHHVMAQVVQRPGWIERISGVVLLERPPAADLVVPFDTET